MTTGATTGSLPDARLSDRAASLRVGVRVLLALMVAVNGSFLLGLILSDGQTNVFVNVALSLATQWVPVAICWLVAAITGFRRLEVTLAASAVTVNALGDSYYALAMDADGFLPFPSPADAGYLLFYPLIVAALVALVRSQLRGVSRVVGLEAAIASLGAATLLAVVLDPVIHSALSGERPFDMIVALAYPLFDLVLLAVMAGILSVPGIDVGPRWWSLATGLAVFAAADIVYALVETEQSYLAGAPLDAAWAIGLAFITWWVAGAANSSAPRERVRRTFPIPVPAIAVVAGLAVLVVATQMVVPLFAVVLAAVTVGLGALPIIMRQAVTSRLLAAQEEVVRKLTELDEDRTAMLASMAEDLAPPIAVITSQTERLLDGEVRDLPLPAVDMLEDIERNGAHLQALVDKLREMSDLQGGSAMKALRRTDVGGVLTRAVTSLRPLAQSRSVHVVLDLGRTAVEVEADRVQLQRAFVHILENAITYSPARGIVRVSAQVADGRVLVRFVDTGPGIAAEDIPRLFTRFFRAGDAAGAGLGLPIAKGIVDAHGGDIRVESEVGVGTTVTVVLAPVE